MENTGIVPTLPVGGNGFGGFGSDGIWALLMFAMIFNGGFGFGGGRPYPDNLATQDFVANQFTQRDIADVNTNLNNGFQNTNGILAGLGSQILENRYATQLANCQTQRDVLTQTNELNTNLLTTALQAQAKMDECCCSMKTQSIENTQKILDALNQNTIDGLRSQINDLKNTITANGIGNTIINAVRPYPTPAWTVSSPYVSITPTTGTTGA